MKKVTYKCKQNDAIIRLVKHEDYNTIDEIHVKIDGENSWLVIGYEDLITAIKKANDKFSK